MNSYQDRFLTDPVKEAAEQAIERLKQQRDQMAEQLDKQKQEDDSGKNES